MSTRLDGSSVPLVRHHGISGLHTHQHLLQFFAFKPLSTKSFLGAHVILVVPVDHSILEVLAIVEKFQTLFPCKAFHLSELSCLDPWRYTHP